MFLNNEKLVTSKLFFSILNQEVCVFSDYSPNSTLSGCASKK